MNVIFTNPAVDDLQAIHEFLTSYDESLAKRTIERIIAKTELLKTGFPDIGQVEPLLSEHPTKPRYLLESNYKIIYRYDSSNAYILIIFDSPTNRTVYLNAVSLCHPTDEKHIPASTNQCWFLVV